jgi:hypothetical protein
VSEESISVKNVGKPTWLFQLIVLALGVILMSTDDDYVIRECTCCKKYHQIEKPRYRLADVGFIRLKNRSGEYHDFIKPMPPREKWEKVRIYCIICNKEHDLLKGPVTGKLYSQVCDRT